MKALTVDLTEVLHQILLEGSPRHLGCADWLVINSTKKEKEGRKVLSI